ncbi:hypothetical protein C8R47DRAFT_1081319 [Mycena vitilis]|nr:hypothetical protein C8R47DRAFT_1081319 [Mycena vitilis]
MARGRKPLDPTVKAERRQASLQRYAEKYGRRRSQESKLAYGDYRNRETLRAAARLRMQRLRAAAADAPDIKDSMKRSALQAAAKYRQKYEVTSPLALGTGRLYGIQIVYDELGLEAFDEKSERKLMTRTQRRHEGRPPPPRPRPRATPVPGRLSERRPSPRSPQPVKRAVRYQPTHAPPAPPVSSSHEDTTSLDIFATACPSRVVVPVRPAGRAGAREATAPPSRWSLSPQNSELKKMGKLVCKGGLFSVGPYRPGPRRCPSPETPSPAERRRRPPPSPLPPSSDESTSDSDDGTEVRRT